MDIERQARTAGIAVLSLVLLVGCGGALGAHHAPAEGEATKVAPAPPASLVPPRLLGHWVAAPPPSERRAFMIARCALATPPRSVEFAAMTPSPEEVRRYESILRLIREEPGSPILAALRERVSTLRAIRVTFTPTKLIAQTPSGVSATRYVVEEDLGDTLLLFEDGHGAADERRSTITFLDDDSFILRKGATRVAMERMPPWDELTPSDVPASARREQGATRRQTGFQPPPPTGDPEFDQCVAEYFACLNAMPEEARSAMGPSVEVVQRSLELARDSAEDRRSWTESCRSTLTTLRAAGYCE